MIGVILISELYSRLLSQLSVPHLKHMHCYPTKDQSNRVNVRRSRVFNVILCTFLHCFVINQFQLYIPTVQRAKCIFPVVERGA